MNNQQLTTALLATIATMTAIQTGVMIYFVFRWREILDRLAIKMIGRWMDGQGLSNSIY